MAEKLEMSVTITSLIMNVKVILPTRHVSAALFPRLFSSDFRAIKVRVWFMGGILRLEHTFDRPCSRI